jgi:hypothetical protein
MKINVLQAVAVLILALLIGTWTTMLALGGLAHIFDVPKLAISYGQSLPASVCLSVLTGSYGAALRSR